MLTEFRTRYPTGSLISDLVTIYQGKYVVRAVVQVDGTTLASGFGAEDSLEQAEDRARLRVLAVLGIQPALPVTPGSHKNSSPSPSAFIARGGEGSAGTAGQELAQTLPGRSDLDSEWMMPKDLPLEFEMSQLGQGNPSYSPTLAAPRNEATSSGLPSPYTTTTPPTSASRDPVNRVLPTAPATTEDWLSSAPIAEDPIPSFSPRADFQSGGTPTSPISPVGPVDYSDPIAQIDVEMKRLRWTVQQGRTHLEQKYGKRSRSLLDPDELLDFLAYLQAEPDPS